MCWPAYDSPARYIYGAISITTLSPSSEEAPGTHIIMAVVRKHGEPLLQERHKLRCHILELMHVAVRIHVAETCPNRIVHKQEICKLVPRSVDLLQLPARPDSVRSYLHHSAVL